MKFRLDPELVERAGLTAKQVEALELYDGRHYGYNFVARALGISKASARDRIREGLRRIERVSRKVPA